MPSNVSSQPELKIIGKGSEESVLALQKEIDIFNEYFPKPCEIQGSNIQKDKAILVSGSIPSAPNGLPLERPSWLSKVSQLIYSSDKEIEMQSYNAKME